MHGSLHVQGALSAWTVACCFPQDLEDWHVDHSNLLQMAAESRSEAVSIIVPTGDGIEWQEGDAVAGVLYTRADHSEGGPAEREEATALAHLTIVCDGMYSSLRGIPSTYRCIPFPTSVRDPRHPVSGVHADLQPGSWS